MERTSADAAVPGPGVKKTRGSEAMGFSLPEKDHQWIVTGIFLSLENEVEMWNIWLVGGLEHEFYDFP